MPRRSAPGPASAATSAVVRAVVLVLGLLAAPRDARADRGQVIIGLTPLVSMLKIDDRDPWGGGGALDLSVGVSDAFALRLTGAFTSHIAPERKVPDPARPMMEMLIAARSYDAYHAGLGVTYTVDILRFVPSLDVAVGLLGSTRYDKMGKPGPAYDFGAEVGLNLDYLLSNRWSIGATVRYHAYLTRITEIPIYLFFGPRVTVRLGG